MILSVYLGPKALQEADDNHTTVLDFGVVRHCHKHDPRTPSFTRYTHAATGSRNPQQACIVQVITCTLRYISLLVIPLSFISNPHSNQSVQRKLSIQGVESPIIKECRRVSIAVKTRPQRGPPVPTLCVKMFSRGTTSALLAPT